MKGKEESPQTAQLSVIPLAWTMVNRNPNVMIMLRLYVLEYVRLDVPAAPWALSFPLGKLSPCSVRDASGIQFKIVHDE